MIFEIWCQIKIIYVINIIKIRIYLNKVYLCKIFTIYLLNY